MSWQILVIVRPVEHVSWQGPWCWTQWDTGLASWGAPLVVPPVLFRWTWWSHRFRLPGPIVQEDVSNHNHKRWTFPCQARLINLEMSYKWAKHFSWFLASTLEEPYISEGLSGSLQQNTSILTLELNILAPDHQIQLKFGTLINLRM